MQPTADDSFHHSLLCPLHVLLSTKEWAKTPFTTTTQPNDPRWQPGHLWKALDKRSLMIPCLSVEGCFWVRNRIRKNAIRNLGHYQAQAPFTTTTKPEDPRQQPGYLWKALDQRSLLIPLLSFDYLFPVRNEIRKNGIGNLGHSQAHQTPDAFYNYYRTRRPQITTRVSLESPWQALSINTLVVIWVFVPSEERNSQKCNRKFGPFSSPSDARRLLQLLPNQKTPDNNQGIFGKPLTSALY